MASQAEAPETPTFDFSNVSQRRAREMSRMKIRLQHVAKQIDGAEASTDITGLLAEYEELLTAQEAYVMEAVVSVPAAWLVTAAPAVINWQEADSLRWLQANRWQALVAARQDAQNPN